MTDPDRPKNYAPYKGVTGPDHPCFKAELDMDGAARRVVYQRGPASEQACRHCSKTARHWVPVRTTESTRTLGRLQWSLDPDDYDPMCRHHRNERSPNAPLRLPGMRGV